MILLCSLLPPRLMNGTRYLVVVSYGRNVMEVEVAIVHYSGERPIIPHITLQPLETSSPFQFQRKQFPLKPCFGMTINKSHGQSLKTVGLHMHQPVFSNRHAVCGGYRLLETILFLCTPSTETKEMSYRKKFYNLNNDDGHHTPYLCTTKL